jgi:hypothetical protein
LGTGDRQFESDHSDDMGKKHREKRKIIKNMLPRGWRENEFGELVRKVSKADIRRSLLGKYLFFRDMLLHAKDDIIESAQRRAMDDLIAIEDARVFGEINGN